MKRKAAAIVVVASLAASVQASPMVPPGAAPAPTAAEYELSVLEAAPPEGLPAAIVDWVQERALTVSTGAGEPIMDIWWARELPPPSDSPPIDPGVAYGSLQEGLVMAVIRLHREHNDYRDQQVGTGTYVARYLRQPNDGNHLGETTYRDFLVLTPPAAARAPGPQRFDVTLGQALQLNTHPFVWGLWPADYVSTDAVPGIASFEADKWAVKLTLPRQDGSRLSLAMVVVGNEWHY